MAREILHVGLGSSACHVSSHYLNLQGLSVTSKSTLDNEVAPSCDPLITHTTFEQVWVPRALLIDELDCSQPTSTTDQVLSSKENAEMILYKTEALSLEESQTVLSSRHWPGSIERLDFSGNASERRKGSSLVAAARESANRLSFASNSRYRAPSDPSRGQGIDSINSNQRTVDWDLLDEEEEEDDEEERRRAQQHQEIQWNHHVYPQLQDQLDSFWDKILTTNDGSQESDSAPDIEPRNMDHSNEAQPTISWRDVWMPPYRPNSILNLPLSRNICHDSGIYYYPVSQNIGNDVVGRWTEHDFLDRIRQMLEECDCCQGITIASSRHGVYAGLTTQLLHYLKDDCPGARRWVWSLDDENPQPAPPASDLNGSSDKSWRTQRVERTRRQMEAGLMWHDFVDSAHSILELKMPGQSVRRRDTLFSRSSILAAALETATLPFRLSGSKASSTSTAPSSRIGLKSYYYGDFSGDSAFGSVSRMTLSEFLTNLQPSPGLPVLELDTLLPTSPQLDDHDALWPRLLQGTAVERDQRVQYQPQFTGVRRPRDVLPGLWMAGTSQGGVLSSLSPNRSSDRNLHTHFALASSLRHESQLSVATTNYVDCLMQGMGIRYRPEQSLAVHVNESLSSLTSSGYGAGSYWKHVWGPKKPVLSILGNTTRFFPQACQIGAGVKDVLSSQNRGFFNRDVANGILPEEDNCHEVLSTIYNFRDRYQPPRGSGLIEEEGDHVFLD